MEKRLLKRTMELALGDLETVLERHMAEDRLGMPHRAPLAEQMAEVFAGLELRDVERRIGLARDRMVRASVELVTLVESARVAAKSERMV